MLRRDLWSFTWIFKMKKKTTTFRSVDDNAGSDLFFRILFSFFLSFDDNKTAQCFKYRQPRNLFFKGLVVGMKNNSAYDYSNHGLC